MKTKLTPFLLFTFFLYPILSCKKPDALNKETSKNLITTAATTPIRYRDSVFANVDSFPNIFYRTVQNYDRVENLKLDVYMPAGDTATKRACIIFIHGGGWSRVNDGGRKSLRSACLQYSKKGYVVISISYRTGQDYKAGQSSSDSIFRFNESIFRATQDCRAAMRFIKKNALTGMIDINKIFIAGGSAGACTAMNVIYLDQIEIGNSFTNFGPLDGNGVYDYPGYSLKVKGLINIEGFISRKTFIEFGNAPMISAYGTEDVFYNDSTTILRKVKFDFDNGQKIHQRFAQLGISTPPIILYPGKGHGAHGDPLILKNTINATSAWMYNLLQP